MDPARLTITSATTVAMRMTAPAIQKRRGDRGAVAAWTAGSGRNPRTTRAVKTGV